MSLNIPKTKDFNETLGKINQQYDELIGAMVSVGMGSQAELFHLILSPNVALHLPN